jgi:transcription elongation factor Elf1
MDTEMVSCPSCGSKRTTRIFAGNDKPDSVWCHSCGAVTETMKSELKDASEPIDEWSALLLG